MNTGTIIRTAAVAVLAILAAGCGTAAVMSGSAALSPAGQIQRVTALIQQAGATPDPGGTGTDVRNVTYGSGTYPGGQTITVYLQQPDPAQMAVYAGGSSSWYGMIAGPGWVLLTTAGTGPGGQPAWAVAPRQIAALTGGEVLRTPTGQAQ